MIEDPHYRVRDGQLVPYGTVDGQFCLLQHRGHALESYGPVRFPDRVRALPRVEMR